MSGPGDLHGKVAVVTGTGRMRGMGRAIAQTLAAAGANVVVSDLELEPGPGSDEERQAGWDGVESLASVIREAGSACLAVDCDVTSERACHELIERTVAEFGRLDVLVNNAAAGRGADRVPVTELSYSEWRRVLRTNLDGTFLASRAGARQMLAQGQGGSIVQISSIAARAPTPTQAAYGGSKAAVNTFSRAMALELAPHGIRVNAVCPGTVDTARKANLPPDEYQAYLEKIPLGRFGVPQDVAELVLFLAGDRARWMTGQTITVDGGRTWEG